MKNPYYYDEGIEKYFPVEIIAEHGESEAKRYWVYSDARGYRTAMLDELTYFPKKFVAGEKYTRIATGNVYSIDYVLENGYAVATSGDLRIALSPKSFSEFSLFNREQLR